MILSEDGRMVCELEKRIDADLSAVGQSETKFLRAEN